LSERRARHRCRAGGWGEKRAITPIGREVGVWVSSSLEELRHAPCPDKPEPPGNHRLIRYVGGSDRHAARCGVGPARQRALSRPCPTVVAGPCSMASCRPCSDHDSKTFTMWRSPLGVNVLRARAPSIEQSKLDASVDRMFLADQKGDDRLGSAHYSGVHKFASRRRKRVRARRIPAGVEEPATIASFS
jgi:hypothetical protein